MKKTKITAAVLSAVLILSGCGTVSESGFVPQADYYNETDETSEDVTDETAEDAVSETAEADEDNDTESAEVTEETDAAEDPGAEEAADETESEAAEEVDLDTLSGVEFAAQMKMGWNLGNTLEADDCGGLESETCWGRPKATQELISYVKSLGVTSIRIPVSWGNHTDDDYQIDPEWMARVREVVDYAYNEGMIVVINSHHDNEYYYPSEENMENAKKFISTVWGQIADEFKDYDHHLVFESMNEPRLAGTDIEWYFDPADAEGKAAIGRIVELNQLFVDTVRASGANNEDRFLMVPSYDASPDCALNSSFSMPEDTASRTMLDVHAYTPYDFAGNANGYDTWSNEKNYEFNFMGKLDAAFICKGTGVVIGECGATNKNNDDARVLWAKAYTSKAASLGIPCFIWDNEESGVGAENFGMIDRTDLTLLFPEVFEAYKNGYPD